ncbi:MAG: BspA family leucine-rich repeat surface protein [Lachnospiraceae bacterium]|nr:BspA family leucine-rich repeat surface protein [Lachnospiraceae bacterium]
MKWIWKKTIATCCTALLLMTMPGIIVLADEAQAEQLQDADVVTDGAYSDIGETALGDMLSSDGADDGQAALAYAEGEGSGDLIDEEIAANGSPTAEEPEIKDGLTAEVPKDVDSQDYATENDDSLADEKAETTDASIAEAVDVADDSASEDEVGLSWTVFEDLQVASNLTATLHWSSYTSLPTIGSLTFKSTGGTLPNNWKTVISNEQNGYEEWKDLVTSIRFDTDGGACYLPTSCKDLFADMKNLRNVYLSNVNTTKVKYTTSMFKSCGALESIEFGNFNTSNVLNMSEMFYGCKGLKEIDLSSFNTSKVTDMSHMFSENESLTSLDVSKFDTSQVKNMSWMFSNCYQLKSLNLSNFNTANVTDMSNMFSLTSNITKLDLTSFDTKKVTNMDSMFSHCYGLKTLDLSSFELVSIKYLNGYNVDGILFYCNALEYLYTPKENKFKVPFGALEFVQTMYDDQGNAYTAMPIRSGSILLRNKKIIDLKYADISGVSISYGYTGNAYKPAFSIYIGDVTLKADTDYTYVYENNVNPGTATITVTGKGNYTGTLVREFEIVKCATSLVSGKTYMLIPKNNPKTAVCPEKGGIIDNTKVYITNKSTSEAMRFKAVKQSDGTWKLVNSKSELVLAVQQNKKEIGYGLVLYRQTEKPAQNWNLVKKYDNSFAIINSVSGLSVALANSSAEPGTKLCMAATKSDGLQRFYLVETQAVNAPFDGIGYVRASKDPSFVLNVSGASNSAGANINLNKFSQMPSKMFKFTYSGGGYYRIETATPGMVLTIAGNLGTDGRNVVQDTWKGLEGQVWRVRKNSDGTLTMTSKLGTVLHISGNKMASGTNVLAKNPSASTAQRWFRTPK